MTCFIYFLGWCLVVIFCIVCYFLFDFVSKASISKSIHIHIESNNKYTLLLCVFLLDICSVIAFSGGDGHIQYGTLVWLDFYGVFVSNTVCDDLVICFMSTVRNAFGQVFIFALLLFFSSFKISKSVT